MFLSFFDDEINIEIMDQSNKYDGILAAWSIQVDNAIGFVSLSIRVNNIAENTHHYLLNLNGKEEKYAGKHITVQVGSVKVDLNLEISELVSFYPVLAKLSVVIKPLDSLVSSENKELSEQKTPIITALGNELRCKIALAALQHSPWSENVVRSYDTESKLEPVDSDMLLTLSNEPLAKMRANDYFRVSVFVMILGLIVILPMLFDFPYRPTRWAYNVALFFCSLLVSILLCVCEYCCRCRRRPCLALCNKHAYSHLQDEENNTLELSTITTPQDLHQLETGREILFRKTITRDYPLCDWIFVALFLGGLLIASYSGQYHLSGLSTSPPSMNLQSQYSVYQFNSSVKMQRDLYNHGTLEKWFGIYDMHVAVIPLIGKSDSQDNFTSDPKELTTWLVYYPFFGTGKTEEYEQFPDSTTSIVATRFDEFGFADKSIQGVAQQLVSNLFAERKWSMPTHGVHYLEMIDSITNIKTWHDRFMCIFLVVLVLYILWHLFLFVSIYRGTHRRRMSEAMRILFDQSMQKMLVNMFAPATT